MQKLTDIQLEKFNRKIDKNGPNGCWIWIAAKIKGGYGVVTINKLNLKAHRVSYEIHNGSAEGFNVCHSCDVRNCVNPDHLFLGSQKDNILDAVEKGRMFEQKKTHCPKGHPYDDRNTSIRKRGSRECKTCRKESHKLKCRSYIFDRSCLVCGSSFKITKYSKTLTCSPKCTGIISHRTRRLNLEELQEPVIIPKEEPRGYRIEDEMPNDSYTELD